MRAETVEWRGIHTAHSRLLCCCVYDQHLDYDYTNFTTDCVWPGIQGAASSAARSTPTLRIARVHGRK